jgi:hypothetical protein
MIRIFRRRFNSSLQAVYLHDPVSRCPHTGVTWYGIARSGDWTLMLLPFRFTVRERWRREAIRIVFRHADIWMKLRNRALLDALSRLLAPSMKKKRNNSEDTDNSAPTNRASNNSSEARFRRVGRGRKRWSRRARWRDDDCCCAVLFCWDGAETP